MLDPKDLAEWQQMHTQLLAKEKAFSDCAVKFATGGCSEAELNNLQEEVRALRLLADSVFERAFGVARRRDVLH